MLTDDQIAEVRRVAALQSPKPHMVEFLAGQVPALLTERDLLLSHLMEACRHIRNTDGVNPLDWGGQGIELLSRVREKYEREYDAQVKGPMPPNPLIAERDLLLAVAKAAEGCSHLYYVNNAIGLKRLYAALAAWRSAGDGVPAAGGAGKEQQ